MLKFQDFFIVCSGLWTTERIYHYPLQKEIERSHTDYRVTALTAEEKQKILQPYHQGNSLNTLEIASSALKDEKLGCPGFAISFNTRSETGEEVSMSLKALFVPDAYVVSAIEQPDIPVVAQVVLDPEGIQGFYLRDKGYSEAGAIAGRFTYQPTRQTLEMTTYYSRSVAVDQMRMIAPDMRMRTIVTYQRPDVGQIPSVITLVGFGVEYRQAA